MANRKATNTSNPEVIAIGTVHDSLKELEPAAQRRVLEYVAGMLGITPVRRNDEDRGTPDSPEHLPAVSPQTVDTESEDSDGISPVALKWMKRNGFVASSLGSLFSLGVDEIDLVAKSVPGSKKKVRMHNVLLLKGIAAYLGTGVARVTHEQVKEACLHYDAFDTTNFAAYLKTFASEVSGTKESGYTLTARGLTNATELIKALVSPKSER